jgi:putative membrane protein
MSAIIRWGLVAILSAAALVVAPGLASGSEAEERRGAELLRALEGGETSCAELRGDDYAALGELAMGRMLGSSRAHEAMDRRIAAMMGERRLDRMHEVMGIRFSGCGSPRFPRGLGGMMGPMGMTGGLGPDSMMGGRGFDPGERGRYGAPRAGEGDRTAPGRRLGPGARMGFYRERDGVPAWLAIVSLILLAAALVAVFALLARPRRRQRGSDPFDLLSERFARGEIGAEEYAERRRLLEGGSG